MLRSTRTLAILVAALLCACATPYTRRTPVEAAKPAPSDPQKEVWRHMLGRFHGKQPTPEGGVYEWVVERAANGTYVIHFRICGPDGDCVDRIEFGEWGVSGPVYFSIFRGWVEDGVMRPSDPSNPYNYDAYRIVRLTGDTFEYETFDGVNRFRIERVGPDFELPRLPPAPERSRS